MHCFEPATRFKTHGVLLLNLALIFCEAVHSYSLTFGEQERHQQLGPGPAPDGHRKHHRSENSPRIMAIDLSALSRSPLSLAVDVPAIKTPPWLMGIDLSALSRNPDPSLPLVKTNTFPKPWDIDPLFPVHRGLIISRHPARGGPVTEYDNMVKAGDVYQDNREEKKHAEPNTEDNDILIFPDTDYSARSVPVTRRFPRRPERDSASEGDPSHRETSWDNLATDSRLLSVLLKDIIHGEDSKGGPSASEIEPKVQEISGRKSSRKPNYFDPYYTE